jgi:3-dehydrosphinganine reductase
VRERFRGRRALITGGSSGIGRALALGLAREGASVAIAARGAAALEAVRAELAAAAPDPAQRFAALPLDVADAAQVHDGVARARAALDGLDLVVNDAGIAHAARMVDTPLEVFRRVLEVNFLGTVYVTHAALPHLLAQRRGHVVNVSSLAGVLAIYGYTAYAASKYAVTGFSEALRQELRPHGIRVSVCLPPDTDTPQLAAENRTKPPETHALAGNASLLTADTVSCAILDGVDRGRFWIVPGREARFVAWAWRMAPGLVRRFLDRTIARAGAAARPPAG